MVFLIDHEADVFLFVKTDTAGAFAFREFATDELSFDEELSVDAFEGGDIDEREFRAVHGRKSGDLSGEEIDDFLTDVVRGPREEGELGDIPGESDAAGDDDVGFGSGSAEPFAAGGSHGVKIHGVFSPVEVFELWEAKFQGQDPQGDLSSRSSL